MKDINMDITLNCPVCGNDQFSNVDVNIDDLSEAPETTLLKCSDCGKELTKAELIEENSYKIDANIEHLKTEAANEMEKEIKKIFRKYR